MRVSRHGWVVGAAGAVALFMVAAQAAERKVVTVENSDYFGFDTRTIKGIDLNGCTAACLADSMCRAFTHNNVDNWCFLKSRHGELRAAEGATAGRVVLTPTKDAQENNLDDLTFVPQTFRDEARLIAGKLARERFANGLDLDAIFDQAAEARRLGQTAKLIDLFRQAAAVDPRGYDAWAGLSRSAANILAQSNRRDRRELSGARGAERRREDLRRAQGDQRPRRDLRELATTGALYAYRNATTTQQKAEALGLLAAAFELRMVWRPAIEATKASLAVVENTDLRRSFERLRAQHGFRMVDYTVESDQAAPRICLQFSETLDSGNDLSSYVTLDGAAVAALEAKGKQLCIEGIRHGSRNEVVLRAGLPSKLAETLEKQVELSIYVRDRAPAVRFSARAYVLPKIGAEGIPVTTINTRTIAAKIYRVGDRGIGPLVADGGFLSALNRYGSDRIAAETGELVWSGEVDVEQVLNREVTTSIPLNDVVRTLQAGAYAIVAHPKSETGNRWADMATQWFVVTDLGVSSMSAGDGMHVFIRSLATAEPLAGVDVRLVARNNEVLAAGTADASGRVQFAPGLMRGSGGVAPALIVAERPGTDYAFLDLSKSPFDLSDRGVAGRKPPGPVDIFLYTERGVYRPGADVHISALARDPGADALAGVPLTFVIRRPDDVEFKRILTRDDKLGGHHLVLPIPANAMQGSWRVQALVDPKAKPVSEHKFLVEDFVPERMDLQLSSATEMVRPGGEIAISAVGKYLFGAPAAKLRLEGDVIVREAQTAPKTAPGFRFGLADEKFPPVRKSAGDLGTTDDQGRAKLAVKLPEFPPTTKLLETEILIRLREIGGRAIERKVTVPIAPESVRVGLRPLFEENVRTAADFEVVAIDGTGERVDAAGATWQLSRLISSYQWYRADGRWRHERSVREQRIAGGSVDLTTTAPAKISVPVEWGEYRMTVESPDNAGAQTSFDFYAGWSVARRDSETPDVLQVGLDKSTYSAGDTAQVRIETRAPGKLMIAVVGDRLLTTRSVDVGEGQTSIDLPVGDNWGSGAYVTATLFRPTDVAAKRMPARSIGLKWLAIDTSARTLAVDLETPEEARPNAPLNVPLKLTGLTSGEEAYVTVAAVDVGVLNLTGYTPPKPEHWYFAQRALGAELRDLYGQLINGMVGTRGQVRSGGDGPGLDLSTAPRADEIVATFSGIVRVDENGAATVSFDIPQFNGTLRIMAVAWSKTGVGHGAADVVVRDPVVLSASLPRVMAPGDSSRLLVDIHNVAGVAGAYDLTVGASDQLEISPAAHTRTLTLAAGERRLVTVPISAKAIGGASLDLTLTGPEGETTAKALALLVRPAHPPVTRRSVFSLAGSEGKVTLTSDLADDFMAGTGTVSIAVSRAARLNIPGLLDALDRYPHGCSEQLTSRALPLLYLNQVAGSVGLGSDTEIRERVRKAIAGVLANQGSAGGFGVWSPGGDSLWLTAYVTDFLTRAREEGFDVPDSAFQAALDYLQNNLNYKGDFKNGGRDVAYSLYVLARNSRASIGDMRYFADSKLDDFDTPLAKAQVGAALALYGERQRARRAFGAAVADLETSDTQADTWIDYGSRLRDGAATLTLAAESTPASVELGGVADLVRRAREAAQYTSTQENAWMLLAAHALIDGGSKPDLEVGGERRTGNLFRRVPRAQLANKPLVVVNHGDEPLDAIVTATGVPLQPEPAGGRGFSISRTYHTLAGDEADVTTVAQNARFVVVLDVERDFTEQSQVVIVDRLPGGFEIDNPRLVSGGSTGSLAWLDGTVAVSHSEFRDGRFVAALTRKGGDSTSFRVAYVVRAVSPGNFIHPPAVVEDMYRPHLAARTETGRVEVLGPVQ